MKFVSTTHFGRWQEKYFCFWKYFINVKWQGLCFLIFICFFYFPLTIILTSSKIDSFIRRYKEIRFSSGVILLFAFQMMKTFCSFLFFIFVLLRKRSFLISKQVRKCGTHKFFYHSVLFCEQITSLWKVWWIKNHKTSHIFFQIFLPFCYGKLNDKMFRTGRENWSAGF